MFRFIIKRQIYDGACLNALETYFETVDAEVPELAAVLLGGKGGGPNGDAFNIPQVIGVEDLRYKASGSTAQGEGTK